MKIMSGNILRKLRKQRGLTINEVALLLKVDPSTISLYERGLRKKLDLLIKFADFYQVPLEMIIQDFRERKSRKEESK